MKVLVTGGCGMIGFHAANYYKDQGHEVTVMDNLERSDLLGHRISVKRRNFNRILLEKKGIYVLLYDVVDKTSWKGISECDLIIHMAGQCGVPTSIQNPRRDFEVNTEGTLNALEYARENGSTLILASTNKVYPIHTGFKKYGDRWGFENLHFDSYGISEDVTFKGARTPYGNSKMMSDLLCQEWAHTYGVRTGVFRMSCIYGQNQFSFCEQGWAVWFIIAAMKNLPIIIFGDGCQVRDMLHVSDCVKAYDAFVQSDKQHGVYNLGGGINNTMSLNECLQFMKDELNIKPAYINHEDWRPLDQKCYISNINKIKKELNWKPTISPQDGLKKAAEWVKENIDIF